MDNDIQPDINREAIFRQVLLLNAKITAFVFGLLCGATIFIATNWLVLKGGDPVGPHLGLLNQFFPGYRVTFVGSIIGFLYGFFVGYVSGALMGRVYNKIVSYRIGK